ncbi:MAG: hypothetical protein N2560_04325, partial [Ignavibacteria bacterium]|nr:hypothetical protein [Ignavibacteria bacterium]
GRSLRPVGAKGMGRREPHEVASRSPPERSVYNRKFWQTPQITPQPIAITTNNATKEKGTRALASQRQFCPLLLLHTRFLHKIGFYFLTLLSTGVKIQGGISRTWVQSMIFILKRKQKFVPIFEKSKYLVNS